MILWLSAVSPKFLFPYLYTWPLLDTAICFILLIFLLFSVTSFCFAESLFSGNITGHRSIPYFLNSTMLFYHGTIQWILPIFCIYPSKKTKQQISLFRLSTVLFFKNKNFFIPAVYKYPFANNPIIAVDSCGQCPNIPVYSLLWKNLSPAWYLPNKS